MSGLQLTVDRSRGAPILSLAGELDIAGTEQLLAALETIEQDEPSLVVIDLSGVSFLDSSGLRAILVAHAAAGRAGRRLAVVRPPATVYRVFEIALLDRRLDFVDSLESVAPVGGGPA